MSSKTSCIEEDGVQFYSDIFDFLRDETTEKADPIRRFVWKNSSGIIVHVITYGATIMSIKVPDKNGTVDDIVMGFNNIKGYLSPLNPYFGATIGRVANRIGYGKLLIGQNLYKLSSNSGEHQLHGGFKGFDKVNWKYYVKGTTVILSYDSKDGEEGFPGNLLVNVTFKLTNQNEFLIDFQATTTSPTYVNLTNHSYFNLAGHNKGAEELYKHVVSINADRITDVDESAIPTGKLLPVANTVFDFQIPKVLRDVIHKVPGNSGFDHNFCINKGVKQEDTFIARVIHPPTSRVLEVYSNQPGVQFYTSNFIPENPKNFTGDPTILKTLEGKEGNYYKHGAFCLETQNYPDAANHENFPKAILYPGEIYKHTVSYKFYLQS